MIKLLTTKNLLLAPYLVPKRPKKPPLGSSSSSSLSSSRATGFLRGGCGTGFLTGAGAGGATRFMTIGAVVFLTPIAAAGWAAGFTAL